MKWSYGRAWKALEAGDTIWLWRAREKREQGRIAIVVRKMKPAADREVELKGGRFFGEFSNMRWEKIPENKSPTSLDMDCD